MEIEKLYSLQEAAQVLGGLSIWTLRAWLSQGRIQGIKIGGRRMLAESELARLIQAGRQEPPMAVGKEIKAE